MATVGPICAGLSFDNGQEVKHVGLPCAGPIERGPKWKVERGRTGH